MILRRFPESLTGLNNNFIVHFTANASELEKQVCPLTIRCTMNGIEKHNTSDGNFTLTSDQFLILNEGQECESVIENESETFSIFFDPAFSNAALSSLITPSDKMLNHSFKPINQPITFLEKLYPHNSKLSPLLMKMRIASRVNYDNDEFLNDCYYELLENLLAVHRNLYNEIKKLPPVKLATKTELYKRICKAKEFIDSSYTENITLEKIAKVSCLSQFHFLRIFKTVYKTTPHQYILKRRTEKAFNLLRNTEMPVTQICYEIGFESVSSFSWMFRNKFGISPEAFREHYNLYMSKFRNYQGNPN